MNDEHWDRDQKDERASGVEIVAGLTFAGVVVAGIAWALGYL